jgi:arsenate reductase
MTRRTPNVLFVCSGNSARSVMAEALLRHLSRGRFNAYSAGSRPTGTVNPLALSTLQALSVPNDGLRSKNWSEFSAPDGMALDFVFTVCDSAAVEICPVWSGAPMTAHWGVSDPAAVNGSDRQRARAFMIAALTLKRRIELMLALPMASLDRMSMSRELEEIGQVVSTESAAQGAPVAA